MHAANQHKYPNAYRSVGRESLLYESRQYPSSYVWKTVFSIDRVSLE